MIDFTKLTKDIAAIKRASDLSIYLESCFDEIEDYLSNISNDEMRQIKFDIEEMLYDLLDSKLVQKNNPQVINAFLILLAEKLLQASLIGAITIIEGYISDESVKYRLQAAKLYLRINDISKDYFSRLDEILTLLDNSAKSDEYNTKALKTLLYFYHTAILQFARVGYIDLATKLTNQLLTLSPKYQLLQDPLVVSLLQQNKNADLSEALKKIENTIDSLNYKKLDCEIEPQAIQCESGEYAQTLHGLTNPSFEVIRDIAYKYIQKLGDPEEFYARLQRGEAIIDDKKLLSKYLVSFGGKHKAKLYSAYEQIISKIDGTEINIVDWGCGQAIATMLLIQFAKERGANLNIKSLTLIEPSSVALSRALLHVDVFGQSAINIKAVNKDFDCLEAKDISLDNECKTLHLFSNVLDMESFKLDRNFFSKISQAVVSDSIFVCVSPRRNDMQNNRLDMFFNFFDESFDVELISSRTNDIDGATRYERIFEVIVAHEELTSQEESSTNEQVGQNYQLDVFDKLSSYSNKIVPVLDADMLKQSIESNPEYVIFKIRKAAEIITSMVYNQNSGENKLTSFSDKIKYLSYNKKIFDKTITSYVQTIRTIGNRGVHDESQDTSKLKLDAHLLVMALVGFLQEITDKKLIEQG